LISAFGPRFLLGANIMLAIPYRFATKPTNVTPEAIAQQVHQAATEICIMHMLKKKGQVDNICNVDVHDRKIQSYLNSCVLQPSADGNWETALKFRSKHVKDVLFFVFRQIGGEKEPEEESKTCYEHVGLPKEQPVLANLSLSDPSVKFIVRLSALPFFGS
jgi:hypothetical protein